jgi:hypothetical protein
MTWLSPGAALVTAENSGVKTTSTSTVRLPALNLGRGVKTNDLRMFGVDRNQVDELGPAPTPWLLGAGSAWTQVETGDPDKWTQEFLAGNSETRQFDLTNIYGTAVPKFKYGQTWSYEQVVVADGVTSVEIISRDFTVSYKDMSIVELPDGSYLMLLGRYRLEGTDSTDRPQPGSSNSLGDIVAWVSPDLTFAGDQVVGPFLVVDSLDAIPSGTVRLWLGVPGGVVDPVRQELLVYYVAESNEVAGDRPAVPFADAYGELKVYTDALASAGFERGIFLKRIPLATLQARVADELASPTRFTDESQVWSDAPDVRVVPDLFGFGRAAALEGTLAGRVQISTGDSVNLLGGPTFEEYFDGGGDPAQIPAVADPQPVWSSTGRLTLYFAAIGALGFDGNAVSTTSGHGLWRASVVPGSAGAAFVVSVQRERLRFTDQIATADSDALLLDPDPVELDDGTWLVFAGQQAANSGPLLVYTGWARDGDPDPGDPLLGTRTWAAESLFGVLGSVPLDRGFDLTPWLTQVPVRPFDLTELWLTTPIIRTLPLGRQWSPYTSRPV